MFSPFSPVLVFDLAPVLAVFASLLSQVGLVQSGTWSRSCSSRRRGGAADSGSLLRWRTLQRLLFASAALRVSNTCGGG